MIARRRKLLALELLTPLVLIAIWWWASSTAESLFFPPLGELLEVFAANYIFEQFDRDVVPSLTRFAAGLSIAVMIGVVMGAALGMWPRIRRDLAPILEFFRALPIAAVIPATLAILGPGSTMEVTLIAFGSVWPILISTADGVRSTEPLLLDTASMYGLNRRQQIAWITIPAALPQVFAGLRIALPIAVALMVIGNMFGSTEGIGYALVLAQSTFNIRDSWAAMIMLGILGAVIDGVFRILEWRLLAWHRNFRQVMGSHQ